MSLIPKADHLQYTPENVKDIFIPFLFGANWKAPSNFIPMVLPEYDPKKDPYKDIDQIKELLKKQESKNVFIKSSI